MFYFKFIVRADKNNAVKLRRDKTEIALGFKISEETLRNALSVKPRPENVKWKAVLMRYTAKVEEVQCKLMSLSCRDKDLKTVRNMVEESIFGKKPAEESAVSGSFIKMFKEYINRQTKPSTKEIYLHTLGRMELYDPEVGGKNFEDIYVKWLYGFDDFLLGHGNSTNTRSIHFRNIRTVFNRAIDFEVTAAYPFRRFKIKNEFISSVWRHKNKRQADSFYRVA